MDPAALLAGVPLVAQTAHVRIWRDGDAVVYTSIDLNIDDAGSVAWRGAVDVHVAAHGWPRCFILDVHNVYAVNSIAMRFQSARWARTAIQQLRQVAIYTGANHKSEFVIRTVLRIAGVGNVALLADEPQLVDALSRYRRGETLAGVPVRSDAERTKAP